jgi:hypothetical protein
MLTISDGERGKAREIQVLYLPKPSNDKLSNGLYTPVLQSY